MTKRVIGLLCLTFAVPATAGAVHFSPWSEAAPVEDPAGPGKVNTESLDGCPIESPDGKSLYIASNRKRFAGDPRTDLDIWVAHRESVDQPWGDPVNLGAPVNTIGDDFCPTPVRGKGLFFVSRPSSERATCGAGDIFFTRNNPAHGWRQPENLGCAADGGPNSALDEQGPSYFEAEGAEYLYFSSGPDIYSSRRGENGKFGPADAVAELNTNVADIQPNVRKGGLEIVFASTRGGMNQNIWTSSREDADDPWSPPVKLGTGINREDANETRPSFSWDGERLYFGRAPGPEGSNDIFVATRTR